MHMLYAGGKWFSTIECNCDDQRVQFTPPNGVYFINYIAGGILVVALFKGRSLTAHQKRTGRSDEKTSSHNVLPLFFETMGAIVEIHVAVNLLQSRQARCHALVVRLH